MDQRSKTLFNFTFNRHWTFKEQKAQASLPLFVGVCTAGYLLRSVVFTLVISTSVWTGRILGPVGLANTALLMGIAAASLWNYFSSKRWAFGIKGF